MNLASSGNNWKGGLHQFEFWAQSDYRKALRFGWSGWGRRLLYLATSLLFMLANLSIACGPTRLDIFLNNLGLN